MRRDWFSCPAAVAVAAAVMCSGGNTAAAPLVLAASVASGDEPARVLAQTALPPPESGVAAAAEGGALPVAANDDGGSTGAAEIPEESELPQEVLPPPGAVPPMGAPRTALVLPGDDALPTAMELRNNPYLLQNADENGLFTGDLSGAYIPPPEAPTPEEKAAVAGTEMLNILGADIYNRRVNITTPPDTEVAEVVRLLAERAGLNFVYGENVIRGRVTLNLRDVPLGAALQSLLATQNLVIIREGENVYRIAPRAESGVAQVEKRTIYIRLNWVPAASLIPAVTSVLQAGQVTAQTEANTLIVTDIPSNIQLVRDLIAQLDVPDKQVMIEARMVEMIVSVGRQQGAQTTLEAPENPLRTAGDQTFTRPAFIPDPLDPFETVTGTDPDGPGPLLPPTSVEPNLIRTPEDLRLGADNLIASLLTASPNVINFGGVISIFGKEFNVATTLDALENRSIANTLANPRVITLNNQEAFIDIKREIPYLELQQGASQNAVQATVKFKDAGVSLRVVPTITNSGFVRMRLEPEQRIRSGTFSSPNGPIPIVDRRQAITNVIVKDEDTVVLGGLRQIESNSSNSQIPWLGQAPIIGWFFKNETKGHLKNDLMLFVTPHIVKAPVLTPAETYKYSRIDAHWDLPDFFFDDSVESREGRHRFDLDMDANAFHPIPLRLPPPAPSVVPPPPPPGMLPPGPAETMALPPVADDGSIK